MSSYRSLRVAVVCALSATALTACGLQPLDRTLDPVPDGQLEFLVESGVYDAHFVTVSNDCSDVRADEHYSVPVRGGDNGEGGGALVLEMPSEFYGLHDDETGMGTRGIYRNPSRLESSTDWPRAMEVVQTISVDRAGPGLVDMTVTSDFGHCTHVATLTLERTP